MKPIRHLSLSELRRVFNSLNEKIEGLEKKVEKLEKAKTKTKTKNKEVE